MSPPMQKSNPLIDPPPGQDLRRRREILIQAQQLAQRIDEVEDELERFRLCDEPQYNAWYETRFTEEKRDVASLESELNASVQFHNSLVAYSKIQDVSMPEAFRALQEEHAAYLTGTPTRRLKIEEDRTRREEFIREDLEREFQEHVASQLATGPSPRAVRANSPATIPELEEEKLKLIYRKLVRRLHPDMHGPNMDATEARWQRRIWHLSQQAKQLGDIPQLESMYRVSLIRQMELNELTLTDAIEVRAWLQTELDRLERELKEAQTKTAWRFSLLTDYYELKKRILADLEHERRFLQSELQEIKGQHAYLEIMSCEDGSTHAAMLKRRRPRAPKDSTQLSLFQDENSISSEY
jgi:hypothetical protein